MTEINQQSSAPLTPEERAQYGRDWYEYTMTFPALEPDCAYRNAIEKFVFAEMWSRPGLDMRSRRWITLACVAAAGTVLPIQGHIYAALKSGDITFAEMNEFTLHFAVYNGWPKASFIDQIIREAWARIEAEGGLASMQQPVREAAMREA